MNHWPDVDPYSNSPRSEYSGVSGGFRAGKRKRGTSLLKRKPNGVTRTFTRDLIDSATGETVATNVRTITYKP